MKKTAIKRWQNLPGQLVIMLIELYRFFISPLLGSNCRFHPTCSCYSQQALKNHGLLKGGYLSVCRLIKCHPYHPGGFDSVPGETTKISEIK